MAEGRRLERLCGFHRSLGLANRPVAAPAAFRKRKWRSAQDLNLEMLHYECSAVPLSQRTEMAEGAGIEPACV